ncbi:DUF4129 domain-containing protein [Kouleothrix sp.]|uniref:DUF4129 domain-containing protein n=1 Tax=Kouleothrix sp. TaxID=2779161 RepID=UPI00391C80CE
MPRLNQQGLVLSALMLGALVAAVCGPVHRFLPGWQPIYVVVASALVALESGLIQHSYRRDKMWADELLRYLVPELFVMLVLMRAATALGQGLPGLLAAARGWLYDPLSVFDTGFVASIVLGLLIGLLAHLIMADLLTLEPRESEAALADRDDMQNVVAMAKHDRAAALGRLSGRFILGGVVLLLALGVEAVNIERITAAALPISWLSSTAALVYFASGFLLYSQGRLALLRARWRLDGARVAEDVPRRWARISWLIIVVVAGGAALLPRAYGLGLLATLQRAIGLIGYAIALVGYALTTLLGLLAMVPLLLLAWLTGSSTTNGQPAPLPEIPPLPEAPPPASYEPRVWAAMLFWLCMLLLAVYAAAIVVQRNPGLKRALTQRGPLLWLLRRLGWLWRDTRAWAGQASERARALLQRRAPQRRVGIPALRLGRLAPRDLVRYFYRSTLRRAAAGGIPRRADQTPYEYSQRLAQQLPEAQPDIAALTESFVLAEYSARPIGDDDARLARRPWERVRRRLRELGRRREEPL